jgi:MFS family permease
MTDSPGRRQAAAQTGDRRALANLLVSFLFSMISYNASIALIGWLVFAHTRSPGVVSIAYAFRFLPLAFTAVIAGVMSDRFGRRLMLMAANGFQALISFAIAIAVVAHWITAPFLILASGAYGLADSVRLVSGMNLTYDLTHRSHPLRGMASANLVSSSGQAIGALIAAGALSRLGPAPAALTVGAAFLIAAVAALRVHTTHVPDLSDHTSVVSSIKAGIRLLGHARIITLLFCVAVVAEWFAFSGAALDPVFAGSVFAAGPFGLGLILLTRATGRIAGSGLLMWQGHAHKPVTWIAWAVGCFGTFLVAFAAAPDFAVALLFTCGAGAASGILDIAEQTAIQASVRTSDRGRAAGLWVLAVGLGPLGILEVGGLAQAVGARATEAINGGIVAVFGLALLAALVWRTAGSASSDATQTPG